jgi:hypothetical protein
MAGTRSLPPLLRDRPRGHRIALAIVTPAVFGAIVGYALGHSEGLYTALSIVAAIGGVGGGFDHDGAAAGAKRGFISGAIYGAFLLIAHEIDGSDATAKLPDPAILLVVALAVIAAALGALGGWLRRRTEAGRQTA